jgi:hypothetical protein
MSNFILDNVSRESCTEPPVDALNQVDWKWIRTSESYYNNQ